MARPKKKVEEVEELQVAEEEKELEVIDDKEDEYEELTVEERITNIEKKSNLILILVAITLAIALITMIVVLNNGSSSTSTDETNTQEQETNNGTYDTSAFKEIKAQDIAAESKGQTIVVMIGRQGCGYCAIYAPIIKDVAAKHDITVRYIDFSKMADVARKLIIDEEAFNTIKNLDAVNDFKGAGEAALSGTPATLFIKNGRIVYFVKGAADANTLEAAFKAAGIK